MPTIHITRGIPASGKSTFAKAWAAQDPAGRVRISRDDVRRMTTGGEDTILPWEQEQHVTRIERQIALTSLHAGKDVIIDAMNLRSRWVRPWLDLGYKVIFHDFPIDLQLALARNDIRGGTVPEDAIRRVYEKFTDNGKLPSPPQPASDPITTYEPDSGLPKAIVVDLDGTLAHMDGKRGPYDWSLVGSDRLDTAVATLVREMVETHHVIIMSGRDGSCRALTETWLADNFIEFDALHMRAAGDTRPDTTVKRELFDAHVRHNYDVTFVIDDRPSVCRQWRAMGLTVMQVGDPHKEF